MAVPTRVASLLQVGPFALIMLFLLVIPMGVIFLTSFFDYGFAEVIPTFMLDNYQLLFSDITVRLYSTAFRHLAIVWLITFVLGFTFAYYLIFHVRSNFWRAILLMAAAIPFWTPGPIRMISWVPLLGKEGLVNQFLVWTGIVDQPLDWLLYSDFAVLLTYVNMMTMAMVGAIANSMSRIDRALIHAARDQGATEWQIITNVIFPLAKPGIAVGTIFIITAVLGDNFIISEMSGKQANNPANAIGNYINAFQYPPAAAQAVLLTLIVFVMVGLILRAVDLRKELGAR